MCPCKTFVLDGTWRQLLQWASESDAIHLHRASVLWQLNHLENKYLAIPANMEVVYYCNTSVNICKKRTNNNLAV